MKKLISTILLGSTLITMNTSADDQTGMLVGMGTVTAAGVVTSVNGLAAGALSYSAGATLGRITVMGLPHGMNYEGLDQESIEVLAGQADLEDQAALSLFKEDVLANQVEIEAGVFAESGEQIDLNMMSNDDFAKLALTVSSQKN